MLKMSELSHEEKFIIEKLLFLFLFSLLEIRFRICYDRE